MAHQDRDQFGSYDLRKKRHYEFSIDGTRDGFEAGDRWDLRDLREDPEGCYVQNERKEKLKSAILRLRPDFRDVVELQQTQEYSVKELAQVLGYLVGSRQIEAVTRKDGFACISAVKLTRSLTCGAGLTGASSRTDQAKSSANRLYALLRSQRVDPHWHRSCREEAQSPGTNSGELRTGNTPQARAMEACRSVSFPGIRPSLDLVLCQHGWVGGLTVVCNRGFYDGPECKDLPSRFFPRRAF